jgi:hypothetical protein
MFDDQDEERKSFEDIQKMPIFIKANELLDLVTEIVKVAETEISDSSKNTEERMFGHYLQFLMENAYLIPAKIAGAEGVEIYDLKMENAAIIRKAARELLTHSTGLSFSGFKSTDYIQLLRDGVEEFRVLFAAWVKTFDPWNYIIDRWGLFNPPGVQYDDPDPDDEID